MYEERLLERISRWERGSKRTYQTQVDVLIHSVLSHLNAMLNTKRGSVPIDERYGIPDFTNVSSGFTSESIRSLQDSVVETITLFEPRLKKPSIKVMARSDNDIVLTFQLEGFIDVDDKEIPLRLNTTVKPDGRVDTSWS
jgi:type VI secretion system protein